MKNKVITLWDKYEGTFKAFWNDEDKWWESVDEKVLGNFEKWAVERVGLLFDTWRDMLTAVCNQQRLDKPKDWAYGHWGNYKVSATSDEVTIDETQQDVVWKDSFPYMYEIDAYITKVKEKYPNVSFKVAVDSTWYAKIDGVFQPTDGESTMVIYVDKTSVPLLN